MRQNLPLKLINYSSSYSYFLTDKESIYWRCSMKKLTVLIFLLGLLDVSAIEIQVSDMQRTTELEGRFDLLTSRPEKVVLDCQSFLQGLFFGPVGEETVVLLEEWECEQLMVDMKISTDQKQKHCLEIDFDRLLLEQQRSCK
jgi:hypothetical protein